MDLLPGRILHVPAIDHRQGREDNALHAADEVFRTLCIADLRAKQKASETGVDESTNEDAVIVEIAIEHEGIWRGERAARAHQAIGWTASAIEGFENCVLIAKPEDGVHLFAVDAGGKAAEFREGPSAGEVGAVALVKLEAGDADIEKSTRLMVAKDAACLRKIEVGHQSIKRLIVPRNRLELVVVRRSGVGISVLPQVELVVHFLQAADCRCGLREFFGVPNKRAGISMRLPTGLEAENIAGNFSIAKFLRLREKLIGVGVEIGAIPEA